MSTVNPQGQASSTELRNLLYGGTTKSPSAAAKGPFPPYLAHVVLTGSDGIGRPLTQALSGRLKSSTRTRTIEGASMIELTFADADRGVLRSPILSTGLPTVSQVASELINDVNTVGAILPDAPVGPFVGIATPAYDFHTAEHNEVARNKELVVQIGVNRRVPREAVVIAMMTLLDESGGVNVTQPDSNGSSGVMQQTPSQGWGSRSQVNDPVYAITKFYQVLISTPGWQNMLPWQAAQRVQRSAWTGTPRASNGYSSELGGNYHAKYAQALAEVAGYRPSKDPVLTSAVAANKAGIVSVSRKASATLNFQGVDYTLVRVHTSASDTTLTFEDALVNQLRRNKKPYSSGHPTSVSSFINQLLAQDGFNPHFVQQSEVITRVDPTGALNAGQSDPATLANFDQLLASDGARGAGTLRVLTKFASTVTTSTTEKDDQGNPLEVSADGQVQDTWTVISGLTSPLRWVAMSNGVDFYIGSESYVSHFLDRPVIMLTENTHGVEWISGEFDLGTDTSNQLSFAMSAPFSGVPAQRVMVSGMGLLDGVWMIHSIVDSMESAQCQVTCQRIQADLEDAEHQAATDKLLTSGGGVSSTNSGALAGDRPTVTGQSSQNGWPAGSFNRADLVSVQVPGSGVSLLVNRTCWPLLIWVAQQFHTRVEPLSAGSCFGYDDRKIRGNTTVWSNHSSGTAIDLNAARHPLSSDPGRTFSDAQITTIHAIVDACGGAIRWGGDYTGRKDSMHFEINSDAKGVRAAITMTGANTSVGR